MHAPIAIILAAAGLAAAQTATSAAAATASSSVTESGCGSQIDTIIASCLGTTQAQLNACATNDWGCMCDQTTNVLTCYNNCPSDPSRNGVVQQQTSYCNAAKAYSSSSSSTLATATSSASSVSASSAVVAVATTSSSGSNTASASSASHSATSSASAASSNVVPGLFAAIFGLAALL